MAGGLLLKMRKYFEVMLIIFEFPHVRQVLDKILDRDKKQT